MVYEFSHHSKSLPPLPLHHLQVLLVDKVNPGHNSGNKSKQREVSLMNTLAFLSSKGDKPVVSADDHMKPPTISKLTTLHVSTTSKSSLLWVPLFSAWLA